MAISQRYSSQAPADATWFGMDFSHVIPVGVGITSATLLIQTNTNPPNAQSDWTTDAQPTVIGRQVWSTCSGGAVGTDYQFIWTVTTNHSQTYHRAALCRCEPTS